MTDTTPDTAPDTTSDTASDLRPQLTIETARTIVAGTLAAGRAAKLNSLAVIVLDAGGHAIAYEREDGASPGRFAIANGKASGAISFGVSSRTLGEWAADRPSFVAAAGQALGGALIPGAGGVLVRDDAGRIIGAVGVTGDTSDHDESAAIAGIESAGLTADAG